MKTPDEIKKGLECCSIGVDVCGQWCPYLYDCVEKGASLDLKSDCLEYVQQLEKQTKIISQAICKKENASPDEVVSRFFLQVQEVMKLQNELSLAKELLENDCLACGHYETEICDFCRNGLKGNPEYGSKWEWCGDLSEDGTEVSPDA